MIKKVTFLIWVLCLDLASYVVYTLSHTIGVRQKDMLVLQQQNEAHQRIIHKIDFFTRLWLWEKRVNVLPQEESLIAKSRQLKNSTDSLLQRTQLLPSNSPFELKQQLVTQQKILLLAEKQQQALLKTVADFGIHCCLSCIRPFVGNNSKQVTEGSMYEAQLFLLNAIASRQRAVWYETNEGMMKPYPNEDSLYLTPELYKGKAQGEIIGKVHFVNDNDIDTTITVSMDYKIKSKQQK